MGSDASSLARRPPPDKYHIQKVKLGAGTFGTVWRAVNRETKEMVAMKAIDLPSIKQKGMKEHHLRREIELLEECRGCDNIAQLWETFRDRTTFYLAMEYCDSGDFGDKVKERGACLNEREACEWMGQILNAIVFLHSKNIIHRDIKPDNFLVDCKGGVLEVLKLADFGLAAKLSCPSELLKQTCGTPAYMSPEQHQLSRGQGCGYSFQVDVWAAGVCMWVLLHGGLHPFVSDNRLRMHDLMEGKPAFRKSGFFSKCKWSRSSQRLCHAMTNPEICARPLAKDARLDEWFREPSQRKSVAVIPKKAEDSNFEKRNEELMEELEQARALKREDAQTIEKLERQIQVAGFTYVPKWVHHIRSGISDVLQEAGFVGSGAATSAGSARPSVGHRDAQIFRTATKLPVSRVAGFEDHLQLLPADARVNYTQSFGARTLRTKITKFNPDDLTYDIDVASRVPLTTLSAPSNEESRWANGSSITTDFFMNETHGVLLHGVIHAYHPDDGTYTLDDQKARILYHHIPAIKIHPRAHLLEPLSTIPECHAPSQETERPRSGGCMGWVRKCFRRKPRKSSRPARV